MFWPFIEIDKELTYCPLADFGTQNLREGRDIYGKAVVAQPLTAHLPLHNGAQVSGKIAVVERGNCDFVTKVLHAQAAGAVAVLVANSSRENPDEAFVMDAGRRSDEEISSIRIPAMMVSYSRAVGLFEQLRECFLDRRELSVTIKFLGAQTSAYVLEKVETATQQRTLQAQEAVAQQEREQQQQEATELLRKCLGKNAPIDFVTNSDVGGSPSPSPSTSSGSSTRSTRSSSEPVQSLAMRKPPPSSPRSLNLPVFLGDSMETLSMASSLERFETQSHHTPLTTTSHWCPMTTSLLLVDVQNYFTLQQNEKCMESILNGGISRGIEFYKRIQSVVVPNLQDVLLACRAIHGVEIVYTVVESATRDGRERSRAHKHASVHIPKGGYGAQVLSSVTPSEDDIVIPRTGVNLFESTNADYVLRNLGVSHLVVAGLSVLRSIPLCIQTALDRGYQITLLKDAIVSGDSSEKLDEMLHRCERLGCQVVSAAEFVQEIHGYSVRLVYLWMVKPQKNESTYVDNRATCLEMQEEITRASGQQALMTSKLDASTQKLSIEPSLAMDDCPEGDRIGGFVWKFPSEGSNCDNDPSQASVVYPRKCRHCRKAWVSSYVNERRHWRQCRPETPPGSGLGASLGAARRVWCEVDDALTALQWREQEDSMQDALLCRVLFHEIADVVVLDEPAESFQVATHSGRRLVFQCRLEDCPESQENALNTAVRRVLDASQWCEYLTMFSRFTQDQTQRQAVGSKSHEPDIFTVHEEEDETELDPNDEVLSEIKRVFVASDVDALEEMLLDEELKATRTLVDCNGNSLILLAIKLDADIRIIKALIKAGVDANAKNADGESPLLLAAASGELQLLRVLLQDATIKVNQRCAMGATAFHAAANAGEVAILRALCDHGAVSTTYVDENAWSVLHYAAACPTGEETMQFLCELTPGLIDATCIQGNTALHVAAGYGCEANVRVLLQTAANPHAKNADGHTAYHVALHNHHISCATVLNEYMQSPREAYEQKRKTSREPVGSVVSQKEDRVAPVETTHGSHQEYCYGNKDVWMECMTEDQIPYYYNQLTGESTWHKPDHSSSQPPPAPTKPHIGMGLQSLDACKASVAPDSQKLPLCMIPLVSPLVSLDDPTAATKLDSRRKKERERRRRTKMLRHRSGPQLGHQDALLPPPPPPPPLHQPHQARQAARVHQYSTLFNEVKLKFN